MGFLVLVFCVWFVLLVCGFFSVRPYDDLFSKQRIKCVDVAIVNVGEVSSIFVKVFPFSFAKIPFVIMFSGARCSSVVRAFTNGAMGRRIDPSWWTH